MPAIYEVSRVLHVIGSGDVHATGISRVVMNSASQLAGDRFQFSLMFIGADGVLGDSFRDAGMSVSAAEWKGVLGDVAGARRFASRVRDDDFDIVHMHAGGLAPRLLVRSVSKSSVIAHYHSLVEESGVSGKGERSGKLAHLVIANSRATARTIADCEPLVIYPGVRAMTDISRRNSNGRVRVGIASRLVKVKGIANLITAVAQLHKDGLQVELEIAGTGPESDALKSHASECGVSSVVKFLGWITDLETTMSGWDIYCQPSLAEGFGISVLEAMGAGLPVVASKVGGLAELVIDGDTGFLVDTGNPAKLALSIGHLARDPELRARMGARGHERALADFSIEREANQMRAAYETLLA